LILVIQEQSTLVFLRFATMTKTPLLLMVVYTATVG